MKIGQVIRQIREVQQATLEDIALAADTNASNLSRIERGVQGYSPDTLERIALALSVTVSELHQRMETASKSTGKPGVNGNVQQRAELKLTNAESKYSALTSDHRELVDEFMIVLLRRQRRSRASARHPTSPLWPIPRSGY